MTPMLAELHRAHVQRRFRLDGGTRRTLPMLRLTPPTVPCAPIVNPVRPEPDAVFGPKVITPVPVPSFQHRAAFRKAFVVKQIINRIAADYGISPAALVGHGRTKIVTKPRFTAMYLARITTQLSLPWIGKHFGGRDHTTVINAIDKTRARALADFNFGSEIAALECVIRRRNP